MWVWETSPKQYLCGYYQLCDSRVSMSAMCWRTWAQKRKMCGCIRRVSTNSKWRIMWYLQPWLWNDGIQMCIENNICTKLLCILFSWFMLKVQKWVQFFPRLLFAYFTNSGHLIRKYDNWTNYCIDHRKDLNTFNTCNRVCFDSVLHYSRKGHMSSMWKQLYYI